MIVFALYFAARANLKPRQREKATLYVIIEYISPLALCWEIPLHFTWLRSIHLPQQLNYQMYSVLRTKPNNTSSSSSTKQGDARRTRKSRNNTSSSSSTKQGDAQRTRKSRNNTSSSSSTKQGDAQRTRKSRNNTSSSSSTKQGDAQRTRKSRNNTSSSSSTKQGDAQRTRKSRNNTSSSSSSSSTKQGDAQRTRKSRNNTSSSSSTKQGDAQRTRKSRNLGKAKRRRKEQMCLGLVSSFLPLQSRTISPNEMKLPNSCKNKCYIHHQPEINNHSMQINNSDSAKNTFKISHKRTKRNVA